MEELNLLWMDLLSSAYLLNASVLSRVSMLNASWLFVQRTPTRQRHYSGQHTALNSNSPRFVCDPSGESPVIKRISAGKQDIQDGLLRLDRLSCTAGFGSTLINKSNYVTVNII